MKKALHLAIAALFFTAASNAQITKGKTLLGGTVAYYQTTAEYAVGNYATGKQHYLTISPSAGKVIRENLVLGLEANFYSTNQEYGLAPNKTENESSGYGGNVFLRRYVPLLKNFYFFGQGAVGYSETKSSQTSNSQPYSETKNWSVSASLYPGLAYAITKKFHVEAALNNLALISYSHSKHDYVNSTPETPSSKGSAFNVSTSLGSNGGFGIGFRLLL